MRISSSAASAPISATSRRQDELQTPRRSDSLGVATPEASPQVVPSPRFPRRKAIPHNASAPTKFYECGPGSHPLSLIWDRHSRSAHAPRRLRVDQIVRWSGGNGGRRSPGCGRAQDRGVGRKRARKEPSWKQSDRPPRTMSFVWARMTACRKVPIARQRERVLAIESAAYRTNRGISRQLGRKI